MSKDEIGTDAIILELEIMQATGAYIRGDMVADRLRQLQARNRDLEYHSKRGWDQYHDAEARADALEEALWEIIDIDRDELDDIKPIARKAIATHGRKKD